MGSLGEQLDGTKVDLAHFETFTEYARIIKDYVHFELIGQILADNAFAPHETADGNPFGGFSEAERMKQSVVESRQLVTQKVREFEQRIIQLHHSLGEIAKNYKTVEELNRAKVDKINELLALPVQPPQA